MRIITGKARGLRLNVPKNYDVRPTADRVKESLFNILGMQVKNASVLDFFAGSGNLGLEAWSRGAASVLFVDRSRISLDLVKGNIEKCRASEDCRTLFGDAVTVVDRLARKGEHFKLIFLDPPYNKNLIQNVLQKDSFPDILAEDALIVAEHSAHDDIEQNLSDCYDAFRSCKYGETLITFIRYKK